VEKIVYSSKFINQEIQMCYLVTVDHNGMAAHLTRIDWRVLQSAVYHQMQKDETDDLLWNDSDDYDGTRMKVQTVKMETVRLVGR